ncbi:MAG: hypothetical protein ISS35_06380 [Kiritimatiellae bacterium]|nr:hypothetical protein [Kiritimatiellia bacterium]
MPQPPSYKLTGKVGGKKTGKRAPLPTQATENAHGGYQRNGKVHGSKPGYREFPNPGTPEPEWDI